MFSMTGYGKAEYRTDEISLLIELKSINNRNLDVNCKVPRVFAGFEDLIRKTISQNVRRGRVDVFVTFFDHREKNLELNIDRGLLKGYLSSARSISEEFDIPNDVTASLVMRNPDLVSFSGDLPDLDGLEDVVLGTTEKACAELNRMRLTEGEKLKKDICKRMEVIRETVTAVRERAPFVAEEYRKKLKERIEEALSGVQLDEARLLNEVAFFADKSNIDEELTRLDSHIAQFYEIIEAPSAGKKLDFLIQEFNRESNTICSKANDLTVTNLGLNLKCEIEKIREQIQNLE